MKKKVRGFWLSIKKAFAIWSGDFHYLTLEESRVVFKAEADVYGYKSWKFTPKWEKCFRHWLDLCTTKEECMDPFFTVFHYGYRGRTGETLREDAAVKWLRLIISSGISKKDRRVIWNLSTEHWGREGTTSHLIANALRDSIARKEIAEATNASDLTDAIDYASSDEVKRAGAEKRLTMTS